MVTSTPGQASHSPRGQGKGGEEGQPRRTGRPGHGLHYGTPGSWALLKCKAVETQGRQRSGGWRGEVPPHRAGTQGTEAGRNGRATVMSQACPWASPQWNRGAFPNLLVWTLQERSWRTQLILRSGLESSWAPYGIS